MGNTAPETRDQERGLTISLQHDGKSVYKIRNKDLKLLSSAQLDDGQELKLIFLFCSSFVYFLASVLHRCCCFKAAAILFT